MQSSLQPRSPRTLRHVGSPSARDARLWPRSLEQTDGGFLRTTLLFFLLLSALVIAGRSGRSASLPVRAIRWFLGLNEADEFPIPLERGEGAGDR